MQQKPADKNFNPPGKKKPRRARQFTDEFKAGAVRLGVEEGRTFTQVAKDLDLSVSVINRWVRQSKADVGKGAVGAVTTSERDELSRLRKEVKVLRQEREILKKQRPSSRKRTGEGRRRRRKRAVLARGETRLQGARRTRPTPEPTGRVGARGRLYRRREGRLGGRC